MVKICLTIFIGVKYVEEKQNPWMLLETQGIGEKQSDKSSQTTN